MGFSLGSTVPGDHSGITKRMGAANLMSCSCGKPVPFQCNRHKKCAMIRQALAGGAQHDNNTRPRPRLPDSSKDSLLKTSRQTACKAQQSGLGLFPAGQKQATVQLPAMLLQVEAADVILDPSALDMVNQAVSAGATGVVLNDSAQRAVGGAAALYEAACKLRDTLRGRASLLLVDRTDIATAAEADGVLLTEQGVPTVLAKRLLAGSGLVGRIVSSAAEAVSAAADGANLVLVAGPEGQLPDKAVLRAAKAQQRSGNPIPVLLAFSSSDVSADQLAAAWPEGLDGINMPLGLLPAAAAAAAGAQPANSAEPDILAATTTMLGMLQNGTVAGAVAPGADTATGSPSAWSRKLISADREALVAEEKTTLNSVLQFLEGAMPEVAELQMLRDALKRLDDLFLVVVVGEFNSGKSTVINALLGAKYLEDGILPTTNEISILKYSNDDSSSGRLAMADGLFTRYLPARLLQEMNIVDTPGTNVILDRQQRLTEEFVPRADLVLFIMTMDQPFSESQLRFLRYIREWQKKVVFVLNKADTLGNEEDIAQVKSWVVSKARELLNLDNPQVIAVSSRSALLAKLAAAQRSNGRSAAGHSVLDGAQDLELAKDRQWQASNFGTFESFIYDFLVGKGDGKVSGEGVRLKLQTPLSVARALVDAAGRKLNAELEAASAELAAVRLVSQQLRKFATDMEKDALAQRDALNKVLAETVSRSEKFIDKTLQVSNLDVITAYLLGNKGQLSIGKAAFESEAVAGSMEVLRAAVAEHNRWLSDNCTRQLEYYTTFVAARQQALDQPGEITTSPASEAAPDVSSNAADQQPGSNMTVAAPASANNSKAVAAVSEFSVRAAAELLDEEIREAIVGTAGTAIGGPLGGLLVASWIPNTLEDILVLSIGGLASYIAVLNLPLRRSEIKSKVGKLAGNFISTVQDKMKEELQEQVGATIARVESMVAPLERACAAEVQRLMEQEAQRADMERLIQELQIKVANVE